MKRGTSLYNNPTCTQYCEYMLSRIAHSTVRGYISALNSPTVKSLLKTIKPVDSVFEIEDSEILVKLIQVVSTDDINKNSHSRYTAALRSYHEFLSKQSL